MNYFLRKSYLLFLVLGCFLYADKIAVATKVKGIAEIMKVGKKDFTSLKAGLILDDGDKIRTGNSGFVAIIFIDDKSSFIGEYTKAIELNPNDASAYYNRGVSKYSLETPL